MIRSLTFVLLTFLLIAVPVFAEHELAEPELKIPLFHSLAYYAAVVPGEEAPIPESLQNNEFYLESLRLTELAHEMFEYGDYDTSSGFAEEAIRFAQLSDEFVANQLIIEAKRLLDWADENDIADRYPDDYSESKNYYEASLEAQSDEQWADAISSAAKSINILATIESIERGADDGLTPLPGQYTVRTWANERDCLWNIAGYSWVYGNPWRWRTLYDANRSKLPDPNNPDLIEPGMVLDIPSISGETRQGMWDPSKTYER